MDSRNGNSSSNLEGTLIMVEVLIVPVIMAEVVEVTLILVEVLIVPVIMAEVVEVTLILVEVL